MAVTGDNSVFKTSLRRDLAGSFVDRFAVESTDKYFLFIGKVDGWTAGGTFGTLSDNRNIDVDVRRNIVGMKQIDFNSAFFMAARYDWTSGNIYTPYNDNTDLANKAYYVMNSEYNVYKCIDNAGGLQSTVEPKGVRTTGLMELADKYVWKYLFTIPEPSRYYIDDALIPLNVAKTRGTATESQNQWSVQQNARDGGIEYVQLTTRNGNYTSAQIIPKDSPNATTSISVPAGATGIYINSAHGVDVGYGNGDYNGLVITVTDGIGTGQRREISGYTGSNSFVQFTEPLDKAVPAGSGYEIAPRIKIYGDGVSADAYVTLYDYDGDVPDTKQIEKIIVTDSGKNYTHATCEFSPESLTKASVANGTAAEARAVISPVGGHGANVIRELQSTALLVVVNIDDSEDSSFFLDNEVRQYGIIKNPILNDTESKYLNNEGEPYRIAGTNVSPFTSLEVTSTSTGGFLPESLFTVGNYVIGKDSKATAKIEAWGPALEGNRGVLTLSNLQGNFESPLVGRTGEGVMEFSQSDNNWEFSSVSNVAEVSAFDASYQNTPPSFNCNFVLGVTQAGGGLNNTTFIPDIGVTGGSGCVGSTGCPTGVCLSWTVNDAGTGGTLVVTDAIGTFATGDSIGSYSSASTDARIHTCRPPQIKPQSGEILYAQNMNPIEKDPEQREQYQIILKF